MTFENSMQALRLRGMARAQALHNLTRACREFGISRTGSHRWRKRYLAHARDGLYPCRLGPRRGRPPLLDIQAERAILALVLVCPFGVQFSWPTNSIAGNTTSCKPCAPPQAPA